MNLDEITLKRLSFIKQLYLIGINQARQNENIAVFSILSFHDSIEMFLKLLAEKKNLNSAKYSFIEYWNNIPDLTLKESMRQLNSRRVNIKHKGLLPAKSEIEISRVNTTDFFNQNTISQFGIDFKDISLTNLIAYDSVKTFITKSENHLNNGEFSDCIENIAYAFNELLFKYEENKSNWGTSPFFFGKSMSFMGSFSLGIDRSEMRDIAKFVDNVKESIESLQKAVKITSFGIDYKEYVKFKILTPNVSRTIGGNLVAQIWGKKKWTQDNCQYCIDFVINNALKLQEFDFDIDNLTINPLHE